MEFTPFVFIDSVVDLLMDLKSCWQLSGYWGKVKTGERRTLYASADVNRATMDLPDVDPLMIHSKCINVSWSIFYPTPYDDQKFISAISTPVFTRRPQKLSIRKVNKHVDSFDVQLRVLKILNAINGNFSTIDIRGIRGMNLPLENLFDRILKSYSPDAAKVIKSDITTKTLFMILRHTGKPRGAKLLLSSLNTDGSSSASLSKLSVSFIGMRGWSGSIAKTFRHNYSRKLPNVIEIKRSDVTPETIQFIMENCVKSRSKVIDIRSPYVPNVSKELLPNFFKEWDESPYPIELSVNVHLDDVESDLELVKACFEPDYEGSQYSQYFGEHKLVLVHKSLERVVKVGVNYFLFSAKE
ncbi:hypothetical protein QR680_012062 [Steinernema hermaphroditum]|uniref:Uncharacterized protein n=1 Tax=Steinernema hermaphroditum TaxID=289476 RepID=A0AA39I3A3_9BILA|nr:hypothetical protein QR680_012062 [Steinernema hermaphroditum]